MENELRLAKPKPANPDDVNPGVQDVNSTLYVSEWLLGSVCDEDSADDPTFPVVTKKVRDEVLSGGGAKPFRRSGLYLTLKVFLQIGLSIHFGDKIVARAIYKLCMLKFLGSLCNTFNEMDHMEIDCDVAIQCLAKTARRIEKLAAVIRKDNQFFELWESIRTEVIEIISSVRSKLDEKWASIQEMLFEKRNAQRMPELDFLSDSQFQMETLSQYLIERQNEKNHDAKESEEPDKRTIHRHYGTEMPESELLLKSLTEVERMQIIIDVENWIYNHLNESHDVRKIRSLAKTYFSIAKDFYVEDPIGYSRMVLAMLKVIQVFVSCAKFKSTNSRSSSFFIDFGRNFNWSASFAATTSLRSQRQHDRPSPPAVQFPHEKSVRAAELFQ